MTTTSLSRSDTTRDCTILACGNNAECIEAGVGAYCKCKAGYYGNPKSNCKSEIGEKYIVIPQKLRIGVIYSNDLKTPNTEKFRKYKEAFETILEVAFIAKTNYVLGSVQISKFR